MLAAALRLRRRADFTATIRGGSRAARGALVVHVAVPTSGAPSAAATVDGAHAGAGDGSRTPTYGGMPSAVPGGTSGPAAGSSTVGASQPAAGGGSQPAAGGASTDRTPAPPPRAGFVVSRAVGQATVRNRVKRRLRHLVRDRLPVLPAGAMLVVRALPAAADRDYAQLGADLDGALASPIKRRKR